MQNPFDWGYLTAPVRSMDTWGPFSIAFVVLFATGFIISISLYNDFGGRFRGNRLAYQTVRRGSGIMMAIFGAGLFFFMWRFLRVEAFTLHMRLWLYLSLLAAVATLGYFAYYLRTVYPEKLRELEAQRLKRQYLAPSSASNSGKSHRRRSRKRRKATSGQRA